MFFLEFWLLQRVDYYSFWEEMNNISPRSNIAVTMLEVSIWTEIDAGFARAESEVTL